MKFCAFFVFMLIMAGCQAQPSHARQLADDWRAQAAQAAVEAAVSGSESDKAKAHAIKSEADAADARAEAADAKAAKRAQALKFQFWGALGLAASSVLGFVLWRIDAGPLITSTLAGGSAVGSGVLFFLGESYSFIGAIAPWCVVAVLLFFIFRMRNALATVVAHWHEYAAQLDEDKKMALDAFSRKTQPKVIKNMITNLMPKEKT